MSHSFSIAMLWVVLWVGDSIARGLTWQSRKRTLMMLLVFSSATVLSLTVPLWLLLVPAAIGFFIVPGVPSPLPPPTQTLTCRGMSWTVHCCSCVSDLQPLSELS